MHIRYTFVGRPVAEGFGQMGGGFFVRFSFSESMCDPSHLVPLAVEADKAGYHAFGIPDSICYPEEAVGK